MSDTLYELFKDIRALQDAVKDIQEQMTNTDEFDKVKVRVDNLSSALGRTDGYLDEILIKQYHMVSINPETIMDSKKHKEYKAAIEAQEKERKSCQRGF